MDKNKKKLVTPSEGSDIMGKCVSVVMKCKTLQQLRNAEMYIYLYYKLYSDDNGYENLRQKVAQKRIDILNCMSSVNPNEKREIIYYGEKE